MSMEMLASSWVISVLEPPELSTFANELFIVVFFGLSYEVWSCYHKGRSRMYLCLVEMHCSQ
jgi:hypothetical protein